MTKSYDLPEAHVPHRGSDVEAYIKARRDSFMQLEDAEWFALDDLLDDYRYRADLGLDLLSEIPPWPPED